MFSLGQNIAIDFYYYLALSEDRQFLTVNFPEDGTWQGYLPDMERVPLMHPCIK